MKGGFERKNLAIFLLLVFLSGFLFFLDKKGWIGPVRGVIERPILAAEKKIYDFKLFTFQLFKPISYWRSSEKEIMRLQGQLRQTAVESSQLSTCLEENQKMRALLGAPLPPDWKFLPAKVIGVSENLKIDKGKKDGVKEGMMVVSENILVGKVLSVGEFASRVQRIDDVRTKIPVVVKPAGGGIQARGLLLGQEGGIILDRVLQSEDIQKGDLVVSSGEADWLPDLLIAQIEEVLPKSAEVYQKARLLPLVDYQKLKIVFVVVR